jgi:hypothetical protein
MGTWGTGSFENDTASDWIWSLKPANQSILGQLEDPFAYPMSAINQLLRSDLYLAAAESHQALAAAECIAAANGAPPADQPEELSAWLTSLNGHRPEPTMIQHAIEAVTTIRNNEQSEVREHWTKADQLDQWLTAIDDLLERLRRPTA